MNRGAWKRAAAYGAALAAGALALQWLDYDRLAWSRPGEIYIALIAAAFLALGVLLGRRLFAAPKPAPFDGNPKAVASLGISPRELVVLQELAAGRSNKQIARRLEVSPNTVKTHVGRLYEKLGAERRTDAVNRARELGIIG
jgi:DNA-binding CsgD family transcriptional regulator